jgi:hypothetical protein
VGLHGVEVDEGPDDDMYVPDCVGQRDNAVRLKEKTSVGGWGAGTFWCLQYLDPDPRIRTSD